MTSAAQTVVFRSLKTRTLLAIFAVSVIIPVAAHFMVTALWQEAEDSTGFFAVLASLVYLLVALLIFLVLRNRALSPHFTLGAKPRQIGAIRYCLYAIPMIATAIACIFLLFLPLSYVWPEFVKSYLLDEPGILLWKTDLDSTVYNIFMVFLLAILAPVMEEVLFRGFLLNRWRVKYNASTGIFFSSLLFGVLHTDVLGATIFGVVMSVIYMKTNSLYGPIIIHMANNTLAIVSEVFFAAIYGPDEEWTLPQFQSEWPYGVIAGLIAIPWLIWFYRNTGNLQRYNRA